MKGNADLKNKILAYKISNIKLWFWENSEPDTRVVK